MRASWRYPTLNYDIGYDEGSWNNFGRKFFGSLTAIGWLLNQVIVAVVLWFTGWAFGFDLIGPIKGPILTIAEMWNANLIGPLGLNELVWFILMSYVAFQVWRGRAMNAARRVRDLGHRARRHRNHQRQPRRLPRRSRKNPPTGLVDHDGGVTRRAAHR